MPLLRIADRSPSAEGAAELHARRWDEHAQAIYRYCFRRTGDAALAEDLTSIVFLEAWRRSGEVAIADENVLAWLYGVATNVLRNQRRHQRRHRAAVARIRAGHLRNPTSASRSPTGSTTSGSMHSILASLAHAPAPRPGGARPLRLGGADTKRGRARTRAARSDRPHPPPPRAAPPARASHGRRS